MDQPKGNSPGSDFINERENIYFRCVEGCREPIMVTDLVGRLIYVNPAWSQTYGYTMREALGQTPRLLRSSHQDGDFYKNMWQQIRDPQIGSWRGQLINRAKDGHEVPVHLTVTPYKNSQGLTVGFMGIAVDLTEQKQLEDHLSQQERLLTLGELTSGLAHEIGTPIGVIRGRAELLLMEQNHSPSASKSADIIIHQADRISTLISTLLRFSRSESSDKLTSVEVSQVVREVEELLRDKLLKSRIQLIIDLPKPFVILGDAGKLEQILINLAMNSIHALLKSESKITAGFRQIRIEGTLSNGQPRLAIEDNGDGVAPALHDKIFVPFFTTQPAGQGTGLGLSIVSRLAHEMGARVDLDRQFQGGARFVLQFKAPPVT